MITHNIHFQDKIRKISLKYPYIDSWSYEKSPLGLENGFETAMLKEPSVFEPLKFHCTCVVDIMQTRRPPPPPTHTHMRRYENACTSARIAVFDLITAHIRISAQSSDSVVFRLQPVYVLCTTYVVGTHLNCIDLSMQFRWVPTTYAFIKKIKKIAYTSSNKSFADLFW